MGLPISLLHAQQDDDFSGALHSNAYARAQSGGNIGSAASAVGAEDFIRRAANRQGQYIHGYARSGVASLSPISAKYERPPSFVPKKISRSTENEIPQRSAAKSGSPTGPKAPPRPVFREPPSRGYVPFS